MTSSSMTLIPPTPNVDDYIGTESCIDLQSENDVVGHRYTSKSNDAKAKSSNIKNKKEKRVFPPPIPLLAQTQNLASHMPWVLKRYYTSEGRLILKEEKVKHHEYFRAHRANGRLTLQLVPLDHDDDCFLWTSEAETPPPPPGPHDEEINNITPRDQSVITNNNRLIGDEENKASSAVGDVLHVENDNGSGIVAGGANGRLKCLNLNSVRSVPSCNFGVPVAVHPIRTVRG